MNTNILPAYVPSWRQQNQQRLAAYQAYRARKRLEALGQTDLQNEQREED